MITEFMKRPVFAAARKIAVISLKLNKVAYHRVINPKGADRMTNSVDADQNTPREERWAET